MAMGRPRMNDSDKKKVFFKIRLNQEDEKKLAECSEHYNISKTDVFRNGLDMMYSDMKEEKQDNAAL